MTDALTHPFSYWLIDWLIYWVNDWLTFSLTDWLTHSLTNSLTHSLTHSLVHSTTHFIAFVLNFHDDVIKRTHFPRYWPFVVEFTGDRWIPLTKASDAELWCFLWSTPEQTIEWTIETPVVLDTIALIMTSLKCSLDIHLTTSQHRIGQWCGADQTKAITSTNGAPGYAKLGLNPLQSHDDFIKRKHFPRNWPFVRGIHRSRWIPHTKASDAELWCFIWSASE